MSARSPTAPSCGAAWRASRRCCMPRPCTSRMSRPMRRQDFVDTNIPGTLNLLEEAVAAGVQAFVFTSTTSVFGDALMPPPGAPAAWITEDVAPVPKNIYGVTKAAAEDLCQLFHRNQGLPCHRAAHLALLSRGGRRSGGARGLCRRQRQGERISRPAASTSRTWSSAHLLAAEQAPATRLRQIHHQRDDAVPPRGPAPNCGVDAPRVLRRRVPGCEDEYARRGWRMFPGIDRVYDNARARAELGWRPRHDFAAVIARLRAGERAGAARSRRRSARRAITRARRWTVPGLSAELQDRGPDQCRRDGRQPRQDSIAP